MRKLALAKGAAKRTIAAASVFMLTCSVSLGGPLPGLTTAYAQETERENAQKNGETKDRQAEKASPSDAGRQPEAETQTPEEEEDSTSEEKDHDSQEKDSDVPDKEVSSGSASAPTASHSDAGRQDSPDPAPYQPLNSQVQPLAQAKSEGSWYLEEKSYEKLEDGTYVNVETQEKITDSYLAITDEDGKGRIIYVDENGSQVKRTWLYDEEKDAFRYVNGSGYVLVDEEPRTAGGYYGSFDEEGWWTPEPNVFFQEELDNGDVILKFSGAEGQIGQTADGQHYYFIKEEDGSVSCYLMGDDNSTATTEQKTSTWINGQLYIGEDGKLLTNTTNEKIDGLYYNFDENGICTMITNTFITDQETENLYYLDENGLIVREQFVDSGGETYYMDEDGLMATRQWIYDEEADAFLYVNAEGHVKKDQTGAAGGYYGHFDENGYWTAIENVFFEDELEDGTTVSKYAGTEGRIGQTGSGQHYCFVQETDGSMSCYLMEDDNSTIAEDPVREAWIDDRLYVDENGKLLTDTQNKKIDGLYYNFDENGLSTLVTNTLITDEGSLYYLGQDGVPVTNQTSYEINGYYYSIDENGVCTMITSGFVTGSDGSLYYLDEDGNPITDRTNYQINGHYYNIDTDGRCVMVTSDFITAEDGSTKYLDEDGNLVTSQTGFKIDGRYYNIDSSGSCTLIISDFVNANDGFLYYVDENGDPVTDKNDFEINGYYYDIDGDGRCVMIISDFITGEDGYEYYLDPEGKLVTSQSGYPIDGLYYDIDANGRCTLLFSTFFTDPDGGLHYLDEDGRYAVSQFMDKDGETIYFDEAGNQAFSVWLLEEGRGWRYVNSQGFVVKGENRAAGGYYGSFDQDGYWTAIENVFFADELADKTPIYRYAGEAGAVCRDENRLFYGFLPEEDGSVSCYRISSDDTLITSDRPASLWIQDLYVGPDSKLYISADKKIDGLYYRFDAEGHSSLMVSAFVTDEETGNRYCLDAEGNIITSQFVQDGDATIYMGEDGLMAVRQWIYDESAQAFRYVDDKGHVIKNKTRITGGYYGSFDADGYWTAIENVFFEAELDDGTTVLKYSAAEGRVFRDENNRYYCFVKDGAGKLYCYLQDGESLSDQLVTNTWMEGYRINGNGILNVDTTEQIDGIYYRFDSAGLGTAVTYPVTYQLNGGKNAAANPAEYTGEAASIDLASPVRDGYTFTGWYTDAALTVPVTALTSKADSAGITLYAGWEKLPEETPGEETDDNIEDNTGNNTGGSSGGSSGSSDRDSGSDRDKTDLTAAEPSITINAGSSLASQTNTGSSLNPAVGTNAAINAESAARAAAVAEAPEGTSVTISTGQSTVTSVVAQTASGSVNGNTIVTAAADAVVSLSETQTAQIATIAVGGDGSVRSLLASATQGMTIAQTSVSTAQGTTVAQNAVLYADGTQIIQKSGAAELTGFSAAVTAAETAIQNGTSTLAAAYQANTAIDLSQYVQAGTAVTYQVTAGTNGPAAQTVMEQTEFTAGQQILVLITDAAGNVTAAPVIVGANGIIQYQIPGVSCIVRLLQTLG